MLANKNIYLRNLTIDDVDPLLAWENDEENWVVSNTKEPFSREDLIGFIENSKDVYEDHQLRFMICLNSTDEAIGCIDLFDFDDYHRRSGVGILIGDKQQRGKGLAHEALSSLIEYAVVVLNLHQLFANITTDNIGSIRLFKNNNFELVGVKRKWVRSGNGWKDQGIHRLLLENG